MNTLIIAAIAGSLFATTNSSAEIDDYQAENNIEVTVAQSSQATAQWDALLKKYVNGAGMVDYKGIKKDPAFQACVSSFSALHPTSSWSTNETKAFWINAYNVYTVKLILDNYPLKSINDLNKPWDQKFIDLAGNKYSLNHIEHEILRPTYNDPRIHFAVNCASFSCPKLHNAAFTPENLESLLEDLAKAFVNDPERNKISKSKAQVSEIFNWFASDFDAVGGVSSFLEKYSNGAVSKSTKIQYLPYNWNLNKQ